MAESISTWQRPLRRLAGMNRKSVTLLLLVLVALAIGGGAATGMVMRGELQTNIPISVSQALIAEKPQPYNFPPNRKFFASTSDDQSRFSIALEMFRGESLTVLVPIVNRSADGTVAEFSVIIPDIPTLIDGEPGLRMDVVGSGRINDVVHATPDSWTFTASTNAKGLASNPPDGLLVTFKVAKTAMSGFFEITGRIRTKEY